MTSCFRKCCHFSTATVKSEDFINYVILAFFRGVYIVEGNYQFAKELSAFDRPAMPVALDYQGRKITHGTWGIKKEIPKDKPEQGINLTAEKTHTFYKCVDITGA